MGKQSGRVAYTIEEAAAIVGKGPDSIVEAIRARKLIARNYDGEPVITKTDVKKWLQTLPNWYVTD